jgi:uncharacterized protein (TIGR02453 family)
MAVGECFTGVGTWRPDAPSLLAIRQRIAGHPEEYRAAVAGPQAAGELRLAGESLKKPPRGFDPGHPLADELRRIDFLLSAELDPALYLDAGLVGELERRFRAASPYMRFLCQALGVPF